jgi:hypothetical protein
VFIRHRRQRRRQNTPWPNQLFIRFRDECTPLRGAISSVHSGRSEMDRLSRRVFTRKFSPNPSSVRLEARLRGGRAGSALGCGGKGSDVPALISRLRSPPPYIGVFIGITEFGDHVAGFLDIGHSHVACLSAIASFGDAKVCSRALLPGINALENLTVVWNWRPSTE